MDSSQLAYVFIQLLQCETFQNEIAQNRDVSTEVMWKQNPDKERKVGNQVQLYRVFQQELYSHIPNVTYKHRWIVCTPLSLNIFVTLASQYHLEYHCIALFETPRITIGSRIEL
jgi:hypothetical protein